MKKNALQRMEISSPSLGSVRILWDCFRSVFARQLNKRPADVIKRRLCVGGEHDVEGEVFLKRNEHRVVVGDELAAVRIMATGNANVAPGRNELSVERRLCVCSAGSTLPKRWSSCVKGCVSLISVCSIAIGCCINSAMLIVLRFANGDCAPATQMYSSFIKGWSRT